MKRTVAGLQWSFWRGFEAQNDLFGGFSVTDMADRPHPHEAIAANPPVEKLQTVVSDTVVRSASQEKDGKPVKWFQTLIPPKMAADMFGRRIAKNYIAIQVTVENRDKELDMVVYDAEVDYSLLVDQLCQDEVESSSGRLERFLCESSSQELSILRGVAEKGQINDPRNRTLRILRGVGTAASGLPA